MTAANASIRWGILGPGKIAIQFAKGVRNSANGVLQAIGSRSLERAESFAAEHGGARAHGSYDALLSDPDVDAVYIATPHPQHAEWAIRAAEAGKHILCEKPIAMNVGEADAIFEAGRQHGVFVMEAFMYRCYPQTEAIWQLVREGKLGEVQWMSASLSFRAGWNPEGRLLNNELGGGGIMDVGCYPVSMARMIAGAGAGLPFAEPIRTTGAAHIGETGVDEWAGALLQFESGMIAECRCGVRLHGGMGLTVIGTEAVLTAENPWFSRGGLQIRTHGSEEVEHRDYDEGGYHHEINAFAARLAEFRGENTGGLPPVPATWMSPEDSMGNMRILDHWRREVGLAYEFEKPGPDRLPLVHGRAPREVQGLIRELEHPQLEKRLSQLALGLDNQPDLPFLRTLVDDFVEKGGKVLDTAFVYGAGRQETLLGEYLQSRPGLRDELTIIGKGAHSPYCYPEIVSEQLTISLARMQLDYVDLYLLHRDNPAVAVDAFVEALNAEVKRGRIKAIGVSNWSVNRIRAFNEVAEARGLQKIVAVSNQCSLAEMIDPVWPGCLSVREPGMREWLTETQTLLLPWSSQARGFFTGRSGPELRADEELVRCWYSDANFERKRRAGLLAEKYGVLPLNIALAWVLAQPFPVSSLVGPRRLGELRTSLPALQVELTPGEVAWLDLECDELA